MMLPAWPRRRVAGESGLSFLLLVMISLGLQLCMPGQNPGRFTGGVEPLFGPTACRAGEPPEAAEPTSPPVPDLEGAATGVPAAVTSAEPAEPTGPANPPPKRLPRSFELLRPIHFFGGQASAIVPDFFRPIAIEQLDRQLSPLADTVISGVERPQLVRAVYVARLAGASLVSTQTTWEFAHRGQAPDRLSLGSIGLAIRSASLAAGGGGLRTDAPPLDTDGDGNVSLTVRGDTRLAISWTAAGRETDREISFDLAIPRASQARWLIAVPAEMKLDTLDGVIQALPSPPPEAAARDSGRSLAWYAIEGGGLSRLRLRVLKVAGGQTNAPLVVRQASMVYELLPSSIRFSSRWVVDPPTDGVLPPLRVDAGRVTAVTVAGTEVRWSETLSEEGNWIQLRSESADASLRTAINIAVDGEAAWSDVPGLQELPWIEFRDCVPELVGNQLPAKVMVDSQLDLMRLGLPAGWDYLSPVEANQNGTTYRLGGPWGSEPPSVRVASSEKQIFANSVVRLSATEARFRAVLESSIELGGGGPRPIRLRIEPGWTVESVVLPRSGRVIELPPEFAKERLISLWPTADEMEDGRLKLRVIGYQALRLNGDVATYPASSFASLTNCRNRLVAVVSPPQGFRWTSEASLVANRTTPESLSAIQRQLLGEVPTEAMLLDISRERMESLSSRSPVVDFNANTLVKLTVENQRLMETLFVSCASATGQLDQLRVEFGVGIRPDMAWSVDPSTTPLRRLLRARRLSPIADDPTEQREIWDLELERSGAQSAVLVGRRERSVVSWSGDANQPPQPLRIDLPSVMGASGRVARVLVPDSLRLVRSSAGVLRVPHSAEGGLTIATDLNGGPVGTMLRYDSSGISWLEVIPAADVEPRSVTWSESIDIVSSLRGGDWITAEYELGPGESLAIDCDADLRLAGVTDSEGRGLVYDRVPGRLVIRTPHLPGQSQSERDITPLGEATRVIIRWSRPAIGNAWLKAWRPPTLAVSGSVLRSRWRLHAASDTLIPQQLIFRLPPLFGGWTTTTDPAKNRPRHADTNAQDSLMPAQSMAWDITPGGEHPVWIVDRSSWLSLAVAISLLLFAASWKMARQRPIWVGLGFVLSALLLPTLSLGWGWILVTCLPIAAGSLLGTTLFAPGGQNRVNLPVPITATETARLTAWLGLAIGASWLMAAAEVRGQSAPSPPSENPPPNVASPAMADPAAGLPAPAMNGERLPAGDRPTVLIPTGPDGELMGDKVYVPQQLYQQLFLEKPVTVTPPTITSAIYRLRLDGMTETAMPSAEWEIRYSLSNLAERSEILLPIRATDLRSVQWLPGGEAKPLRWTAVGDGQIKISLPPTSSAALLLRLVTEVASPEGRLRRVRLIVPAVASASLMVDSNVAVQRFDLTGAIGQTESLPDSGRLSADLGAVRVIDLGVLLRQGARGIPAIGARRYWVHGSPGRGQVECEIEPAESSIQVGTDMPVVILGGTQPTLTTTDWVLQRSETISLQRQLLTFRARRDQPEPIRLLWPIDPITAGMGEADEAVAITIPDVISAGSAPTPSALIATWAGEGYRMVALGAPDQATDASDAIDSFIAAWKGYRGAAQQVIRSDGPLGRLLLVERPRRDWRCEEQHHLHVRQGEMLLSYDGTISRGERSIGPLRLTIPARYEIRQLTVNGVDVPSAPRSVGGVTEVLLADTAGAEGMQVQLRARQSLLLTEPFEPPRVRIEPILQVSGTYSLTRDRSLRIEQIRNSEAPEISQTPLKIGDQLLGGWIPCWTWRIDDGQFSGAMPAPQSDRPVSIGGTFRAEPLATRLEVLQRTGVDWNQSRWMADTLVQVRLVGPAGEAQPLLDDVNVKWPTAWAEQLVVEPAEAWSSQPAIDPTMKIIRIRPDAAARAGGTATIRIRGFRVGETDSMPEIPRPEVLGAHSVRTYLSVPTSAGGRPLVWMNLSTIADELPPELQDPTPTDVDANAVNATTPPERLIFRALDGGANVRLQPSRSEVSVPRATVADIQFFPRKSSRDLVILRWDIEPGDAAGTAIRFPQGTLPVAIWVGGRPVPLAAESKTAVVQPPNGAKRIVEVPFALTGLAQSLVVLCELVDFQPGKNSPLPSLVDIGVDESWLTVYRPVDGMTRPRLSLASERAGWVLSDSTARVAALANSIAKATQASVDGATDRTTGELVAWLTPWDARMNQLLNPSQFGGEPAAESTDDRRQPAEVNDPTDTTDPESLGKAVASLHDFDWNAFRLSWQQYTSRITGGEWEIAENAPSSDRHPAWSAELIAHQAGAVTQLPILETDRRSAVNALTSRLLPLAAAFALAGWLIWSYRVPLANSLVQPAIWLFLLGLTALPFAPVPVALAICLVAASGPWLANRPNATKDRKPRFGL